MAHYGGQTWRNVQLRKYTSNWRGCKNCQLKLYQALKLTVLEEIKNWIHYSILSKAWRLITLKEKKLKYNCDIREVGAKKEKESSIPIEN